MSLRKIQFCLLISFLLYSSLAAGQAARSPFSSFGVGEQFSTALTQNMGMGGTGISNHTYWYVNNMNPSLLVYNRLTTFQAGIIGEQRTQNSSTGSENSGSGNLNYLALAIPIKLNKWTTSLTLMPYTRNNFLLKYSAPINNDPNNFVNVTEQGSGGVNQVTWSNGVSVNDNFRVGLKSAYLFGAVINEFTNVITNFPIAVAPSVYERSSVSGFQFSPAASYHIDSLFNNKYRLNFGAVYDFGTTLNTTFFQRLDRLNSSGQIIDSAALIPNKPGKITLPQSVAFGVSISRASKWTASLDGFYSDYSSYRALDGTNPYSGSNWRVGAGFELIPDGASLSSYLKRATYRTGVSYENYPYLVNGNGVKDFGITFGLSLPVGRYSSLDVALKVGKKGDKALNNIEENYLKLYFGITFMDQWFIKRRFD
ncbi:MAG: hypothetical protein HOP08_07225 [Cyclobacteriaceae bacterium]|nr:hypothetical protein [Cyclobacteriaceae bacterium]